MKFKEKSIKRISFIVGIFVIAFTSISIYNLINKKDINYILDSSSYSYLSQEAKNYIKEVYEETGEVILTEKNREENKSYLNPAYVEYLGLSEDEKNLEDYIPWPIIVEYNSVNITTENSYSTKYDLRDINGKNYITPIRDQGSLGLCWAFASTSVLESHLLKTADVSYTNGSQLISERQIDYATANNGIKDYKSEYVSFIERSLGGGGNFYISTVALASGISAVDYSWKTYNDNDLSQMELYDVLNYNNSLYEVNGTINVPSLTVRHSDESEENQNILNNYINNIKDNIIKYGAAFVSTYYNNKCNYTDTTANNTIIDVYNCERSGGHAMTIIGWDDTVEYDYCADTLVHDDDISNCRNIVSGKGVWILKNSWGEDSDPYPYLAYDSLNTSVHFITDVTTNEEKNWDNSYVMGTEVKHFSNKEYLLSDSRIKDNEKLNKIKFISATGKTMYGITIVDANGETKRSTKYVENPGLVTIEYDTEIVINKDSKITIASIGSVNGEFINKLMIFTSNIDNDPYISLEKIENKEFQYLSNRLYFDTKNIPSDSTITYKLYNESNNDVSANITYENNKVAENNTNLTLTFNRELNIGTYRLEAIYNSNVIASTNIKFKKMEGSGTEDDPYVIKTSEDLDQIRENLDAHYILGNDIDLSKDTREGGKFYNEVNVGEGHGWEAINNFSGTLDGKGYKIKGLYQKTYISDSVLSKYHFHGGLFGYTSGGNITIKNLVLEDFDIECSSYNYVSKYAVCGLLLSEYYNTYYKTTSNNIVFENIAIKNSKVVSSGRNTPAVGGLIGNITDLNENSSLTIKNIYSDSTLGNQSTNGNYAGLLYASAVTDTNISNIQLIGNLYSKTNLLANNFNLNLNLSNIFSSILNNNTLALYAASTVYGNTIIDISNVTLLKNNDTFNNSLSNINNLNIYSKDTELYKLTDKNNYSTWEDFDENWVIKTVDGIPRYPILKFVDFEYTSIDDIVINQELNKKYSIYDYIYPKIDAAKRISFKSNDENIVKISDDGTIIPQASGSTTIHIESYYDGYIKDVPITIVYKPHYVVHFDANNADATGTMESFEVEVGKSFELPQNKFTRDYYEFKEWNTKIDGTGTDYCDGCHITLNENITLYAQWWGVQYEITFDPNGGITPVKSKFVRYNDIYGELPIPTKEGYGFSDWVLGSEVIDSFSNVHKLDNNKVLTAFWEKNAYTIIYDANGGTLLENQKYNHDVYFVSSSLATTYANNGKDKVIYKNIFEKANYEFKYWNTKPDGTGITYKVDDTINLSGVDNDTLRLYAVWEKEKYSITFDSNNGTGSIDNQIYEYDDSKAISLNSFTKTGYIFKEWNTKVDGTGTSYSDGQVITLNENITLYAQWKPITYNVEFNANGGIGMMDKQVFTYDVAQPLNENKFTREGYYFAYWSTNSDGTGNRYDNLSNIYSNLTSTDNETITLYANWSKNPVIDYISNDYQDLYDGKEHSITLNVNTPNYSVKYSLDNVTYDLTEMPKFKEVGEYTVYYKITAEGYTEVTGSNKVKIYGVKSFDSGLTFKDDTLIVKNNSFNDIINRINTYSESTNFNHIDKQGSIISDDIIKTGDKVQIIINDHKFKEYNISLIGDISGDGRVNSADLLKLRQYLLGIYNLSDVYYIAADITNDNTINSADLLRLRQHLLGTKPIS